MFKPFARLALVALAFPAAHAQHAPARYQGNNHFRASIRNSGMAIISLSFRDVLSHHHAFGEQCLPHQRSASHFQDETFCHQNVSSLSDPNVILDGTSRFLHK